MGILPVRYQSQHAGTTSAGLLEYSISKFHRPSGQTVGLYTLRYLTLTIQKSLEACYRALPSRND